MNVLLFLILAGNALSAMYFDQKKIKEGFKSFRESNAYLEDQMKKARQEIQSLSEEINKQQEELLAKGESADEADKISFYAKVEEFDKKQQTTQTELQKTVMLLAEQEKDQIKRAMAKLSKGALLDSSIVLAGGKDVTKELLQVLNGKNVTLKNEDDIKIGFVDIEKFMLSSKEASDARAFIQEKITKFQDLQKKIQESNVDLDNSELENELLSASQDISQAQKIMSEKINMILKKAARAVAAKYKLDMILNDVVVFGEGKDITKEMLEESEKDEVLTPTSKVRSISLQDLIMGYKKFIDGMAKFNEQRAAVDKELYEKYMALQEQKKSETNEDKIKKAEEEFQKLREAKTLPFITSVKAFQESIVNEVKDVVKKYAQKNNISLVVADLESMGVYYSGQDITKEVLEFVNGGKKDEKKKLEEKKTDKKVVDKVVDKKEDNVVAEGLIEDTLAK